MKKITLILTLILALALSTTAFAGGKDAGREQEYKVKLRPLNGSGVRGEAELELEGNILTVELKVKGFERNQLHPQHIHGFADKHNSTCPTLAADANGDGFVDIGEGLPDYGPVLLSLTPFSTAPDGKLRFKATYTINADDFSPLENRAIVLHGLTVNGTYVTSMPVACGEIVMDR